MEKWASYWCHGVLLENHFFVSIKCGNTHCVFLYFFFLLTSMYDYTFTYLFKLNNKGTRMIAGVVLVSLFLTLSRFHTLLWYFYSWLWRSYCQLGLNLNSLTFSLTQYHLKHRTITSATTLANKKINPSGHLPAPS